MTSSRSRAALTIGYGGSKVGSVISPWPIRKVSRSSTVIGRRAETVSSSGPSMRFRTWRWASSGRSASAGSSSASLPSSTSIIVASARIGFVIEVMRKIVSRRIGSSLPNAITPIVSTRASSPWATRVTMPGSSPFATRAAMASCRRSRPACDLESIMLIAPTLADSDPRVGAQRSRSLGIARQECRRKTATRVVRQDHAVRRGWRKLPSPRRRPSGAGARPASLTQRSRQSRP